MPAIVTDIEGGFFLRFGAREPRVWNERRYLGAEWHQGIFRFLEPGLFGARFAPTPYEDELHVMAMNEITSTLKSVRLGTERYEANEYRIPKGTQDIAFCPQFGQSNHGVLCINLDEMPVFFDSTRGIDRTQPR